MRVKNLDSKELVKFIDLINWCDETSKLYQYCSFNIKKVRYIDVLAKMLRLSANEIEINIDTDVRGLLPKSWLSAWELTDYATNLDYVGRVWEVEYKSLFPNNKRGNFLKGLNASGSKRLLQFMRDTFAFGSDLPYLSVPSHPAFIELMDFLVVCDARDNWRYTEFANYELKDGLVIRHAYIPSTVVL